MKLLEIYILFWLFSFLGWIMEIIVCSLSQKRLVNRGFLLGPYCPIYGFGGVLMLLLSPYKDNPIICFILAMVMCSTVEYVTSYLMEKLFKVRWWDYSQDAFNLNGRVCLRNAIAFGVLGLLFTSYIDPFFMNVINSLNNKLIIVLSITIFTITNIDMIISFKAMNNIKRKITKNINKLTNKDATNDIKDMIHNLLINNNYLERRIIKVYRYFIYQKEEFIEKIDDLKDSVNNNYFTFTCLMLICLSIGIIIGSITSNYRFWLILALLSGLLIDIIIVKIKEVKNGRK